MKVKGHNLIRTLSRRSFRNFHILLQHREEKPADGTENTKYRFKPEEAEVVMATERVGGDRRVHIDRSPPASAPPPACAAATATPLNWDGSCDPKDDQNTWSRGCFSCPCPLGGGGGGVMNRLQNCEKTMEISAVDVRPSENSRRPVWLLLEEQLVWCK